MITKFIPSSKRLFANFVQKRLFFFGKQESKKEDKKVEAKTNSKPQLEKLNEMTSMPVIFGNIPSNLEEDVEPATQVYKPTTDTFKYKIKGYEIQRVDIDLAIDQSVTVDSGNNVIFGEGVEFESTFGGIGESLKRMIAGGTLMLNQFKYKGDKGTGRVMLSPKTPAKIVPLQLQDYDGHSLILQKGAFLCSCSAVSLDIYAVKKFGFGFMAGEGFILQKVSAPQGGTVLLKASGCVYKRTLRQGEVLRCSVGMLVAMEEKVEYDIQRVGDMKNMFLGGQGLFFMNLTGPGTVWLQGLSFEDYVAGVAAKVGGGGGMYIGGPSATEAAGTGAAAGLSGSGAESGTEAESVAEGSIPSTENISESSPQPESNESESMFGNMFGSSDDSASNNNDEDTGMGFFSSILGGDSDDE